MVEPTLIRLSLRLALLAVGLVISGMSIPVVDVDVQADRFLHGAASTHWLKGTPNTGPPLPLAPDPPAEGAPSRSLSIFRVMWKIE